MSTVTTNRRTIVMDLRITLPSERRIRVFNTFDSLKVGDTLKVIYDHDLQPLYHRLLTERRGEFVWQSEQESLE